MGMRASNWSRSRTGRRPDGARMSSGRNETSGKPAFPGSRHAARRPVTAMAGRLSLSDPRVNETVGDGATRRGASSRDASAGARRAGTSDYARRCSKRPRGPWTPCPTTRAPLRGGASRRPRPFSPRFLVRAPSEGMALAPRHPKRVSAVQPVTAFEAVCSCPATSSRRSAAR
jgi:hypothetical protein